MEQASNYEGSVHNKWRMVFVVLSYHTNKAEAEVPRFDHLA